MSTAFRAAQSPVAAPITSSSRSYGTWSLEAANLSTQQRQLEREAPVLMQRVQSSAGGVSAGGSLQATSTALQSALTTLAEDGSRLARQRDGERRELQAALRSAASGVARLAASRGGGGGGGGGRGGDAYIAGLRRQMGQCEHAIFDLKAEQRRRYEVLCRQEAALQRDLRSAAEHFESWGDGGEADEPAAAAPAASRAAAPRRVAAGPPSSADAPAAVVDFDDYVALHGSTGGWSLDDHESFLAVWRQADKQHARPDNGELLAAVCGVVASCDGAGARTHARWHRRYLELLDAKREAVKQWREHRDIQRRNAALIAAAAAAPKLEKAAAPAARRTALPLDEMERRKKLASWKERKREEQEALRQQQRKLETAARALRQRDHTMWQLRNEEKVVLQQAAKIAKKHRKAVRAQEQRLAHTPSHSLSCLQARDRDWANARKQQIDNASKDAPSPATPRSKSALGHGGESRVLEPTQALLNRKEQREAEEAEEQPRDGRVLAAAPRAGPLAAASWRAGL